MRTAQHKLAALMGIEGGHSIENSLDLLRYYYKLGVRYMTLTWSNSNDWADSSGDFTDPKVHHTKEGLTEFGKDVVYEMNRLGMMVDISHVADQTFYRTLILTRAPVIASHSSARALTNAPRNMTDEMLRALANQWRRGAGELLLRVHLGELAQGLGWRSSRSARRRRRLPKRRPRPRASRGSTRRKRRWTRSSRRRFRGRR